LVADDDRHFGVLACFEKDVGGLGKSFTVRPRQVGEVYCEVRQDAWYRVGCVEEFGVGDAPETG
jgi:hypothetical protein